jgi:hypothetical protein
MIPRNMARELIELGIGAVAILAAAAAALFLIWPS